MTKNASDPNHLFRSPMPNMPPEPLEVDDGLDIVEDARKCLDNDGDFGLAIELDL